MTDDNQAAEQAQAQLDSIRAMVTRLEHAAAGHKIEGCNLAVECPLCTPAGEIEDNCHVCSGAGFSWAAEEYDDYDVYHDEDSALQAVYESPLSVEGRSGWQPLNDDGEAEFRAVEFAILLCAGGPAVRIRGELNSYGEPDLARLEYRDWGTPWTEYRDDLDEVALLTYCAQFLGA